jgi:hypothetical protein
VDDTRKLIGFYRGVVQNNKDPINQRRLQVLVPQTTGAEVTDWAWPVEPHGIHSEPPKVGQGVWVSYISGDSEYPVWIGSFGKHQDASKPYLINPLSNSVLLSDLTSYVIVSSEPDGTQVVDLTKTILAMANKLKNYESRITSIESQLTTLHTTLATRTSQSHTHGSNG